MFVVTLAAMIPMTKAVFMLWCLTSFLCVIFVFIQPNCVDSWVSINFLLFIVVPFYSQITSVERPLHIIINHILQNRFRRWRVRCFFCFISDARIYLAHDGFYAVYVTSRYAPYQNDESRVTREREREVEKTSHSNMLRRFIVVDVVETHNV